MVKNCRSAPECGHAVCRCTPAGGLYLAEWNASHSRRWNRLRTNLRRAYPGLEYMRGIEVQKRGALHDHAIVWSPVPISRNVARELAIRAGFGHAVDLAPIKAGPSGVPSYVTKSVAGYVTKATDMRGEVPWLPEGAVDDGTYLVDEVSGEVLGRSPRLYGAPYRTWSCSRAWGLTMAAVRAEAKAYAVAKNEQLVGEAVRLLTAEFGQIASGGSPPAPS